MGDAVDLVEFVRARLDEDEALARAATRQRGRGEWKAETDARGITEVVGRSEPGDDSYPNTPVVLQPDDDETTGFIAAHDPARVLREVDAKRRIIADLEQAEFTLSKAGDRGTAYDVMTGAVNMLRRTVRLLAVPYADHPDYRDEWRP
ncbi:DUF6221 family protein [Streptomyces acidiscabies]|uniref:DUF6221 family protein n=1 Tax=Streptomyces acidiscabies TaxID=42234 RepID=A0ABU4LY48_9ACTN|nr:DUF6221 family protein [Streptomyces acidiscabies]MDX3019883.1 DUF6221 family protein [Streptomyces acidiscabies]